MVIVTIGNDKTKIKFMLQVAFFYESNTKQTYFSNMQYGFNINSYDAILFKMITNN